MNDNKKKLEGFERFIFIDEMNDRYYSPREVEYRIPAELKDPQLLNTVLGIRRYKSELAYPLLDQKKQPFRYWKTPRLDKMLHQIDIQRSRWQETKQSSILNELLLRGLIDEAFYSSWIEGAQTTRNRAEVLLRQKEVPRDRSERMVWNNAGTMNFILENLGRKLDEKFVCQIHRITTEHTLDPQDEPFTGKYRDGPNYVIDGRQRVNYIPPPASEVRGMMQNLYEWVNLEEVDTFFLHPVLKASIIHFYTVYVHPFFDGNGRTARALMYHYLLKHGYGFMKFFSISKGIAAKRSAYYQAILNVEQYDSDLTYFLLFSTQMVLEAITTVEVEKSSEQSLANWLTQVQNLGISLNPRQEKLFRLHFRQGILPVTIKKYQKLNRVVYETARTDLSNLCDQGLLKMIKKGREFVFIMPEAQLLNAHAPADNKDSSHWHDPSGQ